MAQCPLTLLGSCRVKVPVSTGTLTKWPSHHTVLCIQVSGGKIPIQSWHRASIFWVVCLLVSVGSGTDQGSPLRTSHQKVYILIHSLLTTGCLTRYFLWAKFTVPLPILLPAFNMGIHSIPMILCVPLPALWAPFWNKSKHKDRCSSIYGELKSQEAHPKLKIP
jgi:hypothetical protein